MKQQIDTFLLIEALVSAIKSGSINYVEIDIDNREVSINMKLTKKHIDLLTQDLSEE